MGVDLKPPAVAVLACPCGAQLALGVAGVGSEVECSCGLRYSVSPSKCVTKPPSGSEDGPSRAATGGGGSQEPRLDKARLVGILRRKGIPLRRDRR